MQWIRQVDQSVLLWCNQKLVSPKLDRLFGWMTHLGGAAFTLLSAAILAGFAKEEFRQAGLQSLCAIVVSHLIVVVLKKSIRRMRPFRKLTRIRVGKFPLEDHSFPSGHSTAIFALLTPLTLITPLMIAVVLLCVAMLVAISRVYWGYHYPLDCVAGGVVGSVTALMIAW